MKSLKVCYTAPEGGAVDATPRRSSEEAAALERVDNVRLPLPARAAPARRPRSRRLPAVGERSHAAGALPRRGAVGEGAVAAIAQQWEELTNLSLSFVTTGAAEIRISFLEKGSRGRPSAPTRSPCPRRSRR